MKNLLAVLLRPAVLSSIGIVVLVLVVWFAFALAAELLPWVPRWAPWVASAVLVVVAAVVTVMRRVRARREATRIEQQLRAQAQEQTSTLRPDRAADVAELQRKFDEALGALKGSKLGRAALHALPWYVIIGPPGSGKTTMLVESGLHFPSHMNREGHGVKGIGGTRNCDWWFTDQAILLDTAGRYTTQDEDREEWLGFLDLLARARRGKPINGALVAISVEELLDSSSERIVEHANLVRARLDELTKRLELVFPVYVIFTKCDLLDGFVEFFEGMNRDQRAQVFGCTPSAADLAARRPHEIFAAEFDLLEQRLRKERLVLLAADRAKQKQRKVFSFPMQFAAAKEKLTAFVEHLTKPDPFHEAAEIRGFYFTSGTQEGEPIDRVLASLGAAFGLESEREGYVQDVPERKSYFIEHLFTKVVFPERFLARSSAKAEQRRRVLRRASMIGSVALTVIAVVWMFVSFFGIGSLVARADAAVAGAKDVTPEMRREQLELLRLAYVDVHERWTAPLSLWRPSRDAYERVHGAYVDALKHHFLQPAANAIGTELEAELARRDAGTPLNREGYERMGRLVRAYRMIGDASAELSRGELRATLRGLYLWSWDDAERGKVRDVAEDHPEMRHLTTFLERVIGAPGATVWRVAIRPGVAEAAERAIVDGDAVAKAARALFDEKDKTTFEVTPEEIEAKAKLTAERAVAVDDRTKYTHDLGVEARRQVVSVWRAHVREAAAGPAMPRFEDVLAQLRELVRVEPASVLELAMAKSATQLAPFGFNAPEGTWYAKVREHLEALLKVVDAFVKDGVQGGRVLLKASADDLKRIEGFAKQLADTEAQVAAHMARHTKGQLGEDAAQGLTELFEKIRGTMRIEARLEANEWWAKTVGEPLRALSARYPLTPDATDECDPAAFVAMFGGKGTFASSLAVLRTLRETQVGGAPFLPTSPRFESDVEWVAALRATLLKSDDRLSGDVQIALMDPGRDVAAVLLQVGGAAVVDSTRMAGRSRTVTFDGAAKDPASLAIELPGDRTSTRQELALPKAKHDGWRWLRILQAAATTRRDGEQIEYLWKFAHRSSTGREDTYEATIRLLAPSPTPYEPGFFPRAFEPTPYEAR